MPSDVSKFHVRFVPRAGVTIPCLCSFSDTHLAMGAPVVKDFAHIMRVWLLSLFLGVSQTWREVSTCLATSATAPQRRGPCTDASSGDG